MRRGLVFSPLAAYVLLSCQQISFRKSPDLGRLLRDGELMMAGQTAVLHQNFYSYTNPTAAFPNHHWLAELLAYGASSDRIREGLNLSLHRFRGCGVFSLFPDRGARSRAAGSSGLRRPRFCL